jgi:hypothetical protein
MEDHKATYRFRATIWKYSGNAAWHFVTLPNKQATMVRSLFKDFARPFGSIPVEVTIGNTTWRTSIFADSKSDSYVLPLKADVRRREKLAEGNVVDVSMHILT